MLTKNAYALIIGMMNKASTGDMTLPDGTTCSVKLGAKDSQAYIYSNTAYAFDLIRAKTSDSNYGSSCLYFGTGDTAPSVSDYKLGGSLINNLRCNSAPFFVNITNNYAELQATIAVKNTGSGAATIKEIGLFGELYSTSLGQWIYPLLDRTVLATPITIGAGETKSITYNIRFTLPTA